MLYKVNSNSNRCLFIGLPSPSTKVRLLELQPQLIHWSLKYQGVKRPNLQDVSYRPRFVSAMTFSTLCLIRDRWMGLRV